MNRPRAGIPAVVPFVLGLCVFFLLLSLAAGNPVSQGPASAVLAPIQRFFTSAGQSIGAFLRPFSPGEPAPLANTAAQQQVIALAAENARLREYQTEAVQLRELLKFSQANPALEIVGADIVGRGSRACDNKAGNTTTSGACAQVYAQVISGEPSPYARYLTINAGRRDGVLEGMPVVGGGGALIGRVGRVSEATSMVQLLNDPASFINVQLVGSRATGTLAGQADGTLRLQNVLQTDTVTEGDLIVTSGLGGGLPPGLTVGQVDALLSKELATLKEATVRPGADNRRIEAVLVIKFVPPK